MVSYLYVLSTQCALEIILFQNIEEYHIHFSNSAILYCEDITFNLVIV